MRHAIWGSTMMATNSDGHTMGNVGHKKMTFVAVIV